MRENFSLFSSLEHDWRSSLIFILFLASFSLLPLSFLSFLFSPPSSFALTRRNKTFGLPFGVSFRVARVRAPSVQLGKFLNGAFPRKNASVGCTGCLEFPLYVKLKFSRRAIYSISVILYYLIKCKDFQKLSLEDANKWETLIPHSYIIPSGSLRILTILLINRNRRIETWFI